MLMFLFISTSVALAQIPAFEDVSQGEFQNDQVYSLDFNNPVEANGETVKKAYFWIGGSANDRSGNPHDLRLYIPEVNFVAQGDYYWSSETVTDEHGNIIKTKGGKMKTAWNGYSKSQQRDMLRWQTVKVLHQDFSRLDDGRRSNQSSGTSTIGKEGFEEVKTIDKEPYTISSTSSIEADKEVGNKNFHWSPVIVPIKEQTSLENLITSKTVRFDLNGDGIARIWSWVSKDAGFLVWTGQDGVYSGEQLFGTFTWGKRWKNGYQPMSTLDKNNDGKLTGDEFTNLAIWVDQNQNGRAESNEIKSMEELNITSLSVRHIKEDRSKIYSPDGVTFEDGTQLKTYDYFPQSNPMETINTK